MQTASDVIYESAYHQGYIDAIRELVWMCDNKCFIEDLKGLPIEDIKIIAEQLKEKNNEDNV